MNRLISSFVVVAFAFTWPQIALAGDSGEILFVNSFEGTGNVPQFTPVDDQAGVAGQLLQVDVDTSEPAHQAGLSFSLPSAPAGMDVQTATGLIRWTPNEVQLGVFSVTVRVEDLAGLANTTTFDVEIVDPSAPPLVRPINDQVVLAATLFELSAIADDPDPGDAPTFSLDAAPPGLTIDAASGLMSWMPGAGDVGVFAITVRATDASGQFDTASFQLTVVTDNQPPVLEPIADRGGAPGVPLTEQPVAIDPDDTQLTWSLDQRPTGMAIDADTGAITWTPGARQFGPHDVVVRVRDPLGFADTTGFEIFVDRNRPPIAVDDSGYRVERGDTLAVPALGVLANDEDPNDDPLTAQLETGPQRGSLALNPDGSFEYTPDNPAGTIDFELKWEWRVGGGGGGTVQPLIADLDLDGIPEIIMFKAFGTFNQGLVAFDGATGEEKWRRVFEHRVFDRDGRGAIGDIDLDGYPEIVWMAGEPESVPTVYKQLYAFEHHGGLKWVSEPLPRSYFDTSTDTRRTFGDGELPNTAITLADLDQDGIPEILVAPNHGALHYQVWDAEGRKLDFVELEDGPPVGGNAWTRVEVADLDLDGDPEIIVGTAAFSHDGEQLWARTDEVQMSWPSEFPIIANIDDDPYPELIRRLGNPDSTDPRRGNIQAWNHDGSDLWEVERNYGFIEAPMTVADVDGDGLADILVPGNASDDVLEVLNGSDGSVKWSQPVPNSDRGGATVFDLDRDGFNEVVFTDNDSTVHIWDGRDGTEKATFELLPGANRDPQPNTLPVFADVDGDGRAELVTTVGSAFTTSAALRIWESPNDDWAPMRGIWNQQRYHVTNINDDLTIPSHERPHWLEPGLNRAMINERLPEARVEESDFFEYSAFDGELTSNVARVDIAVLPPNATPRILSSPKRLASPGFEYVYPVLAVDSDPGETLTLEIGEGPAGMFIDAQGLVRWTPDAGDLGEHVVVVEAVDSIGARASQNYVLEVVAPVVVPDLAGRSEAEAVADLAAVTLEASPILDTFSTTVPDGEIAAQDPAAGATTAAGADVRVEISRGPVPVTVPDVIGLTEDDAIAEIGSAGLAVGAVTFANDAGLPVGAVATQDPAPRSSAPPASPVDLVISGGPRAVIEIEPTVIPAGDTATVSVTIAEPDGTPMDPQPPVTLALDIEPGGVGGSQPTLDGSTIETFADSQGEFRVSASFSAPMPETISVPAVIAQPISDGTGTDVFSRFVEHLETYGDLVDQLIAAVDLGDTTTIETVDVALADLEDEIDLGLMRVMTPLAPEGGVPPDPAAAAVAGFPEGQDDAAWVGAGIDLVALTAQLEQVLVDGTAPDAVLNALNQDLADAASAVAQLDPGLYGVLDGSEIVAALLGTRMPRLLVADIRAVRQALRDAGIVTKDGSAVAGRFTLPSLMSAASIRQRIISDVYVPYLGEVARAAGIIIGADLLDAYTNGGAIPGIVTGASLSIHVFNIPNSVIEGFGFDTLLPEGNAVTMVGPDLVTAVLDILTQQLPQAEDLKDINSIMEAVQGVIELGDSFNQAFDDANSVPGEVLRGCILDNNPACRQLVYPDGFASVYTSDGGLSLPAPVAIIVRNLAGGGVGVFVANFVPTTPDED